MAGLRTCVLAGLTFAVVAVSAQAAERRTLVVAGGEVTGYSYPVAGALCRAVNKEHPKGLGCAVLPSSGSAASLAALKSGDADFVLVQARALAAAQAGDEGFKDLGAMPDLRAVMSLHGEATVVLVRPDSNIHFIADLKGKRVNLGRPGSFQRAMGETVLDAAGLSPGDLSPLVELDFAEQGAELCHGNIDAAIFTGVHPLPEVAEAIEECGAQLLGVKGKNSDALVKKTPWLSPLTLKPGTYEGQKQELATVGVRAVLATSARVAADDVYETVKAVYGNFSAVSRLHPVLRSLTKKEAAKEGGPAKPHDGAERFYAEAGLK